MRITLANCPDALSRSLLLKVGDLNARWLLLNKCEAEYDKGNMEGFCALYHAMVYLEDRLNYELWPPPNRMTVCLPVELTEGEA